MNKSRLLVRALTVLALAGMGAGLFAITPAAAVKYLKKKGALALFYTKADAEARFVTKADAEARFVNVGEKATSATSADTATNADKLDNVDSSSFLGAADAVILQAQQDSTAATVTETAAGHVEVNSVSITVPTSGALIISGTTLVNNSEAVAKDYQINAKVNGTGVSPVGWTGYTILAADGTGTAEVVTFSYTVSHPVSAGTYTVTQEVGPFTGTATFVHNNEELTVQFVPNGTVASTA